MRPNFYPDGFSHILIIVYSKKDWTPTLHSVKISRLYSEENVLNDRLRTIKLSILPLTRRQENLYIFFIWNYGKVRMSNISEYICECCVNGKGIVAGKIFRYRVNAGNKSKL